MAVNVTFVPAQMVVAEAITFTLTGKFEFTVIVMLLLVAVIGDAQVAFDVKMQVTTWPFVKALFV